MINEIVRVSTITNSTSLKTINCIFEHDSKLILVSDLKPDGLLIDAQILCWILIKLKVSLKMLQHPTHLEERIFCSNRFLICAWIVYTEETFELIPYAPNYWKELTDISVTINGAVVSSKEPEVYLWLHVDAIS